MKRSAISAFALALFVSHCGTKVGNPRKPSEEPTTDTTQVALPDVAFEFTDALTQDAITELYLNLNTAQELSIVRHWTQRVHHVLKKSKNLVERLRTDGVNSRGRHADRGPDAKLEANLQEWNADSLYDYSLTVCDDGQPFMFMKWANSGSRIEVIRDFNHRPLTRRGQRAYVAKVTIDRSSGTHNLTFNAQGEAWDPPRNAAGDWITEAFTSSRDASEILTLKGVSSWHSGADRDGPFAADSYLVARVEPGGVQEFLGFRSFNQARCSTFNEASSENPGWCLGGVINQDRDYSNAEILASLQRLKSLGFHSKDNLTAIEFPDEAVCQ